MDALEAWEEYELEEPEGAPGMVSPLWGAVTEFPLLRPDHSLPWDAGHGSPYELGDEEVPLRSYDAAKLFAAMHAAGVESLLGYGEQDPAAAIARRPGGFSEDWEAILSLPFQVVLGDLFFPNLGDDEMVLE